MIVDAEKRDYTKFAYRQGTCTIRTVQDRICEITYTGTPFDHDEHETLCDTLTELDQLFFGVTIGDLTKRNEAARIIRAVKNRICDITDTGVTPSPGEREMLCDLLVELHQLLYTVTLFAIRTERSGRLQVDDEVRKGVTDLPTSADIYSAYADDEIYSDGRPVITRSLLPLDTAEEPIPASAYRGDVGEEVPPGGVIHVWRPGEVDRSGLIDDDPLVDGHAFWKASADLRAERWTEWARTSNGRIRKRAGPNGRIAAASILTAAGLAEGKRLQELRADSITIPAESTSMSVDSKRTDGGHR